MSHSIWHCFFGLRLKLWQVLNFKDQTEPNSQSTTKPNQTQYEKFRPKTNQTAIFRHNPNRIKPKTKHLNISKYKIFLNCRKIMLLLFLNNGFWEILIFVSLKVFLYSIYIFFKKFEKKILEKSCKISDKLFTDSVKTKQNQTERYSQKPEQNYNWFSVKWSRE
jgi:hypothetical protein